MKCECNAWQGHVFGCENTGSILILRDHELLLVCSDCELSGDIRQKDIFGNSEIKFSS